MSQRSHDAEESIAASDDQPETTSSARKKPPSPLRCRDFIRREAAFAMPTIVATFVKKAMEGSVPHFASLAKVGGFDQRASPAEMPKRRTKSLGRQLLDEVEAYEARQAAERAAAEAATSPIDSSKPQEKA